MHARNANLKTHLRAFDFQKLFFEELGWDRSGLKPIEIRHELDNFTLSPVAEKRGLVAFLCRNKTGALADSKARRFIEKQIARSVHEHIIIYVDHPETIQVWQWIRREPNKPAASREHRFSVGQDGEALTQRLQSLAFRIEEEDNLNITRVADRARSAFDVDKITKRFYGRFKSEHDTFLEFIRGVSNLAEREWYASLMLNRLMFVYFIQKKGFLDNDPQYLQNRLRRMKDLKGKDKFQSFYRHFLLRLFHEGLGSPRRTDELDFILGKVPYLNGGLFDVHEIEEQNSNIQISDEAFERLFTFFESYQWHLDDRPIGSDDEINPDVLGYIFEKYINQKQMGAYYTKEDITEYISRSSILPHLLAQAAERRPDYFGNGGKIWENLSHDGDRYIYQSIKSAAVNSPPKKILEGVKNFKSRENWNSPCDLGSAIATETWREFMERRTLLLGLQNALQAGQINSIDKLISNNLNIAQFVQDAIDNCDDPNALEALYDAVSKMTIIDPTCGSGAFIFSALNLLEPIYESCIERMQGFVAEASPKEIEKSCELRKFQSLLKMISNHPNRSFFIIKSAILNNLYGVDIMKEAVEVCKLRLFLKLAAQVERVEDVEPLPDIDFNFKPGNTLVGLITKEDLDTCISLGGKQLRLGSEGSKRILEIAGEIEVAYSKFRELQTDHFINSEKIAKAKSDLKKNIASAQSKLDALMAIEYGIDAKNEKKLESWKETHRPFHWLTEFYGILKGGGFDVVIGNPPYVEYSSSSHPYLVKNFSTLPCGDLYAFVMERSIQILRKDGVLGMIVPISIAGTDGFDSLRIFLSQNPSVKWISNYAERPAKLFNGVEKRLTIWIQNFRTNEDVTLTTNYKRWFQEERSLLFEQLKYTKIDAHDYLVNRAIPKVSKTIESAILSKLARHPKISRFFSKKTKHKIFYTRKLRYFIQFFDFVPKIKNGSGETLEPSELKEICLGNSSDRDVLLALLNSNLFFWFFNVYSDVRNVNSREIVNFRLDLTKISENKRERLSSLSKELMKSFKDNSRFITNNYKKWGTLKIQSFQPKMSKHIIDKIDLELAELYQLTEEEIDFILNYDVKFRMEPEVVEEGG